MIGSNIRTTLNSILALCVVLSLTMLTNQTKSLSAQDTPIVIAHRGASAYLPEHTLAAKALAYGMGADYIEQDLVLTRDNVPIVLHDVHLDTISDVAKKFPGRARKDGRYYAIDFTIEEIKQLQCEERFNPKSGDAVYDGRFPKGWSSFQIPTFAEEIELIKGLNKSTGRNVGIYPEIKQPNWHRKQGKDISSIVIDVLEKYGYTDKTDLVYLQCFEADELKRIRGELKSKLKLVQLSGDGFPTGDSPGDLEELRDKISEVASYADGIGPSISLLVDKGFNDGSIKYSKLVEEAHRAKLVVHPYTLRNDALPEGIRSFDQLMQVILVDGNVDGAFTDFPDKTKQFLLKTKR